MLVGKFCNPVYWNWAFSVGPGLSVDKLKRMNCHSPKKQNRFQAYRFDNFSKYQGRTYQTSFAHVRILADGKLAAKHLQHGEVIMGLENTNIVQKNTYFIGWSQKWCILTFRSFLIWLVLPTETKSFTIFSISKAAAFRFSYILKVSRVCSLS